MSGLAGLLAGHRDPGVYRWHAAFDVGDVRRAVEHGHARFGYVDGWTHTTKAEVLDAFAEALEAPDVSGPDLGALAHCVDDIDGPHVLLWDGWSPLARSEEQTFSEILGIFTGCAESGKPFSLLLRGEGPELEVADLDH